MIDADQRVAEYRGNEPCVSEIGLFTNDGDAQGLNDQLAKGGKGRFEVLVERIENYVRIPAPCPMCERDSTTQPWQTVVVPSGFSSFSTSILYLVPNVGFRAT